MKITLFGASGYMGHALWRHFRGAHELRVVSRSKPRFDAPFWAWDGENLGEWTRALDGAEAVINFAGRTVNCRYTPENKRQILESRVRSTRILGEAISRMETPPRVWLNASTATIYRDERERDMDENSGILGSGFSVEVAKSWEAALFEAKAPQTRRVALRMSMIFGRDAPVYEVFGRLVRLRLGGFQGDGGQIVSWIHERDCCRALEFLLENDLGGPVNVCSPHPLPNRDFMRELREASGVKWGLFAPKMAMEIGAFLMKTETELPLKSRRAVPQRLLDAGFAFEFPTWREAVRDIVQTAP